MRIIACDFDGTITEDVPFPRYADIRQEALLYIPILFAAGYTLVLWTARSGKYYDEAIQRLDDSGLLQYFSDISVCSAGHDGKIAADFYIDDRATVNFDWTTVVSYLISCLEEN